MNRTESFRACAWPEQQVQGFGKTVIYFGNFNSEWTFFNFVSITGLEGHWKRGLWSFRKQF